jgi:4-hydroxy-4-methyl-2-oxoglutarate aldolase
VVAAEAGVACIPRLQAAQVAADGRRRVRGEAEARAAFAAGELGLDRHELRPVLERLGVRYLPAGPASPAGSGEEQA